MLYATLKITHLLAVTVWLGGMVFLRFFLRPALTGLKPAERVTLLRAVLGRFFRAVLVLASLVVLSGFGMVGRNVPQMALAGAHFNMPLEWLLMAALGLLMFGIFLGLRFALYPQLDRAVQAADWIRGAMVLIQMQRWVGINLALGLLIVILTLAGVSS